MASTNGQPATPPSPVGARMFIVGAIAVGIVLRFWNAFASSLWLDELHSLSHATQRDMRALLEHVHWDFHPPLFYAALHFLGGFSDAHALRALPILTGLLALIPLANFARRSTRGDGAVLPSVFLFCTLPFLVHYGAELRSYAWLMVTTAFACQAAFTDIGTPRARFIRFAAAVGLGMNSTYLMAPIVVCIGVTRLLVRDRRWMGLPALVCSGTIGVSMLLPWFMRYADWMYKQPGELLRPESTDAAKLAHSIPVTQLVSAVESAPRTLVLQVGALGGPWAVLGMVGAGLLALGGGLALIIRVGAAVQRARTTPRPELRALFVFGALTWIAITLLSLWQWQRISLQYYIAMAWIWPLVIVEAAAAIRSGALRTAVVGCAVIGALVASVAEAGGHAREDTRTAVVLARRTGAALAASRPTAAPLYSSLFWQPPIFEHTLPYEAYGPDLAAVEPDQLPGPGEAGFERPVVLITRGWYDLFTGPPGTYAPRERIRAGRHVASRTVIDRSIMVWVIEPN